MNMRLGGAVLFHTEGRTDGRMQRHDGIKSRFSKFWERAWSYIYICFNKFSPNTLPQWSSTERHQIAGDDTTQN